ncbi:MAG: zinc-ribbon domain-containing protein [Reyranellales bacterium]
MQVTCPNCAARYAVDPLAIGPAGRTVQCARCHDRWFQMVERERPVPDLVIRPPPQGSFVGMSGGTSGRTSLPVVIAPRAANPWAKVLAAAVVLVVVAIAALFAFRNDIVALLPGEWRAMLHSDAASSGIAPGTVAARAKVQLEIDLDSSKIELVDGRYVVRGEIVNTGRIAGSTHTLKLTFKNQDEVLGERAYDLVEGPISPGARLSFSQPLDEPPAGTTDIVPNIE